jgi:hypothetical protein
MKAEYRKAFNKLKKAGIAVQESESKNYGVFWINCETDSVETQQALEYYDNYWGSEFLNETLEESGLYFEWDSPAYATVEIL